MLDIEIIEIMISESGSLSKDGVCFIWLLGVVKDLVVIKLILDDFCKYYVFIIEKEF